MGYRIVVELSDGGFEELDDIFDTEEEAGDAVDEAIEDYAETAEDGAKVVGWHIEDEYAGLPVYSEDDYVLEYGSVRFAIPGENAKEQHVYKVRFKMFDRGETVDRTTEITASGEGAAIQKALFNCEVELLENSSMIRKALNNPFPIPVVHGAKSELCGYSQRLEGETLVQDALVVKYYDFSAEKIG